MLIEKQKLCCPARRMYECQTSFLKRKFGEDFNKVLPSLNLIKRGEIVLSNFLLLKGEETKSLSQFLLLKRKL